MDDNKRIRIPNSGLFKGRSQVRGLVESQSNGLIQELKIIPSRQHSDQLIFKFRLCNSRFHLPNGDNVALEYSHYYIRLEYGNKSTPKVFITSHRLSSKCNHLHRDGSLCLYKPQNFPWSHQNSLAGDILPLVYTWIYFYEKWLKINIWYGYSAKH